MVPTRRLGEKEKSSAPVGSSRDLRTLPIAPTDWRLSLRRHAAGGL